MFFMFKCLSVEATSISIALRIVSVNTYLSKFFILLLQFIITTNDLHSNRKHQRCDKVFGKRALRIAYVNCSVPINGKYRFGRFF